MFDVFKKDFPRRSLVHTEKVYDNSFTDSTLTCLMKRHSLTNHERTCRIPLMPDEHRHGAGDGAPRMSEITWRIFRIMAEFVEGFEFLSGSHNEITILGSARLVPGSHWYKEAEKFATLLGKAGFTVITGGGPGIMEAANKGAKEAGAESIGINIQLPHEQRQNDYVTRGRGFHYFFTRKVMLAASAQAYVFFPGGFGTCDEFFDMITLIQTKKAHPIPMICVGRAFWEPLRDWMSEQMVEHGTINQADLGLFTIVDTADEAFALVKNSEERTFF